MLPVLPFWICESIICLKLGFTFVDESETMCESQLPNDINVFPDRYGLNAFINKLKKGAVSVGGEQLGMIDISSALPNKLGIYYQKHGEIAQYKQSGEEVTNTRRLFYRYHVSC